MASSVHIVYLFICADILQLFPFSHDHISWWRDYIKSMKCLSDSQWEPSSENRYCRNTLFRAPPTNARERSGSVVECLT